jgi:chromate transport protein ChrA
LALQKRSVKAAILALVVRVMWRLLRKGRKNREKGQRREPAALRPTSSL